MENNYYKRPSLSSRKKQVDDKDLENITNYLENISSSTCLIFWQTKNIDKTKRIYKSLKKQSKAIEFVKLKAYEYERWVEKKIFEKNKTITKSVLKFFIENSSYLSKNSSKTLRDIDNEIEKITNYIGTKKQISIGDIENLLSRSIENDIFKMVDAIGKKDKNIAIKLLNDMLKEGENGFIILSMVVRQFRILLQCKYLKEKGYSPDIISNKLNLAPFIVRKGLSQSEFFKGETLKNALNSCREIDLNIKSGKTDIRLALEMLIFQYAK